MPMVLIQMLLCQYIKNWTSRSPQSMTSRVMPVSMNWTCRLSQSMTSRVIPVTMNWTCWSFSIYNTPSCQYSKLDLSLRATNTCRPFAFDPQILVVEYLSFLSNNLKRPPYQNALWLDLLFISFLLLIKSGFVICQFTVGSLNPLNSSPYFVPGGILFP